MIGLRLTLAAVLALALLSACSTATPLSPAEIAASGGDDVGHLAPPGPGLLSGEAGEFVLFGQ